MTVIAIGAILVTGCGRSIRRTDASSITDLAGRWNDTDARTVAETITSQIVNGEWLNNYESQYSESEIPVIVIGRISNATTEHIDTEVFVDRVETALINSNLIEVVARNIERSELRDEREYQSVFASSSSAAEWGNELGADYILMGTLKSIIDEYGGERVIYYLTSLDLINTETAVKVWSGECEIKKIINL